MRSGSEQELGSTTTLTVGRSSMAVPGSIVERRVVTCRTDGSNDEVPYDILNELVWDVVAVEMAAHDIGCPALHSSAVRAVPVDVIHGPRSGE